MSPAQVAVSAFALTLAAGAFVRDKLKFGHRVLHYARSDLGLRAPSSRVSEMLFAVGILDPSADWCAAAVSEWIHQATLPFARPPIPGSAGAQAIASQFRATGHFLDADTLRWKPSLVEVGMIPVWRRGDEGWQGHTGVVSQVLEGGKFKAIEGNTPTVAENEHDVTSDALIGMGYF